MQSLNSPGKTKQKTRPPYATWTWKKSQKQDGPGTEIRTIGEKKMEKYFIYLDVVI